MLAQAAQFLASALPWPEPGSWTGTPPFFVNIHYKLVLADRVFFPGRACTTVEQAVNQIEYRLLQNGGTDIYACMSGQALGKSKLDKRGRTYWAAQRSLAGATWLKSIWIDIDVKDNFKTTLEAAEAFAKFRSDTALPEPSFVVMSGSGGFHVHWVMSEPIPAQDWLVLSSQLVAAIQVHGFAVEDTGVSTDAARLLRIPNTFNYKHTPPKPVYLQAARQEYRPDYLKDILKGYQAMPAAQVARRTTLQVGPRTLDPALFAPRPPIATSALGEGIERSSIELEQVKEVCPLVREAVTHGGNDHGQPLWHALASLSVHLVDGRDAFHNMSDGYPTYDEVETDNLYDRVEADHLKKNTGWTTCSYFERAGSKECASCAHRLEAKSPLHFVQRYMPPPPIPVSPQPPPLPPKVASNTYVDPPAPYWRDPKTGYVYAEVSNDDGVIKRELVFEHPMWKIWPQANPPGLHFETVYMTDAVDVLIPYEATGSKDKLAAVLAKFGVPAWEPERARKLVMSFLTNLRERKHNAVQAESQGWAYENGEPTAFVYGRWRYNCAGNQPSTIQDPEFRRQYSPTGSIDPWRKALELIEGRIDLQALIASAFAAPLMRFTGKEGFVLCAYSPETGIGKSTALKIGASVWSDPVASITSFNGTANSLDKKLGTVRHLPVYYDEAQMELTGRTDWVPMVFGMVQGKSKDRLDRNSQMQPVAVWNTILVLASNSSLISYLNSKRKHTQAHIVRVFEFRVKPAKATMQATNADHIISNLANNYGNAGAILAEFFGQNAQRVRREVQQMEQFVAQKVLAVPDERFWVSAVATTLLGAMYGNELGLTRINEKDLFKFLSSTLTELRQYRSREGSDLNDGSTLAIILGEFIAANRNKMVRTDIMPARSAGRPAVALVLNDPQEFQIMQTAVARHVTTTNQLYVERPALTKYLRDNALEPDSFFDRARSLLGAQSVRATLTAGTKKSGGQVHALLFNLTHPYLQDIIN